MKADFIIAGVQKAGTTSLHAVLDTHPDVFMTSRKELHFFDDEKKVDWDRPDYSVYDAHFADGAGKLVGEATPVYTYWPTCAARIKRYRPDIRLIVTLREPVSRAYSHWEMEVSRDADDLDFATAIREGRTRVVEDKASLQGCHRVYSYVERGFYAYQVRRLLSHFAREQLLFVTVDQLKLEPAEFFQRICSFLEIAPFPEPPKSRVVLPTVKRDDLGPISAEDRRYLAQLYADDIRETAELTGLDLSRWQSSASSHPRDFSQMPRERVSRRK